jgi:hypothetical protein
MATFQLRSHLQGKPLPYRGVFLAIALLVTTCGIVLWLLSIGHVIADSWASIIGAFFTVVGAVIALLQLFAPSLFSSPPVVHGKASSPALVKSTGTRQLLRKSKGMLRIHGNEQLRGTTINICRGFDVPFLRTDLAANIVERLGEYGAEFYDLEPGNYTIYTDSHESVAKVTIYTGRITEVDWRNLTFGKKQGSGGGEV